MIQCHSDPVNVSTVQKVSDNIRHLFLWHSWISADNFSMQKAPKDLLPTKITFTKAAPPKNEGFWLFYLIYWPNGRRGRSHRVQIKHYCPKAQPVRDGAVNFPESTCNSIQGRHLEASCIVPYIVAVQWLSWSWNLLQLYIMGGVNQSGRLGDLRVAKLINPSARLPGTLSTDCQLYKCWVRCK